MRRNPVWRFYFISLLLLCTAAQGAPGAAVPKAKKTEKKTKSESLLPAEVEDFLGKPSPAYEKKILRAVKDFRAAKEKGDEAALRKLSYNPFLSDFALWETAKLELKRGAAAKTMADLERLQIEIPWSPLVDKAKDLYQEALFQHGMHSAKKGNNQEAISSLYRALQSVPLKEWENREDECRTLLTLMRQTKHPLTDSFTADLLLALPSGCELRGELSKKIDSNELRNLNTLARYRSTANQAGVKAVNPDQQAFDEGIAKAIAGDWEGCISVLAKAIVSFPQSEHMERMRYWIARALEASGKKEEAKGRYEELWQENPFSYYGLQSALNLGKDLKSLFTPPKEGLKAEWEGSLLSRQQIALWRLRAFLETGLSEEAREEAEGLSQYRPAGVVFGQNSAAGALLLAELFHAANYHGGAFLHSYAAFSLDRSLINEKSLRLLFPEAFQKDILAAAEENNLHPMLVASLTKQESAFQPDALSKADAMGLMQLILPTAKELKADARKNDLLDPFVNTKLGAAYLRKLLDRFNGNIALALAGYNAGPTRAAQWQKKFLEIDAMKKNFQLDLFVETIPFTETRRYVSSILRNYVWYRVLAGEPVPTTLQELNFEWQRKPPPKP